MITLATLLEKKNLQIIAQCADFYHFINPCFYACNEPNGPNTLYILVEVDYSKEKAESNNRIFLSAQLMKAFHCNVFSVNKGGLSRLYKDEVLNHSADIHDQAEIERVYKIKFPTETIETITFLDPPQDRLDDMKRRLELGEEMFGLPQFPLEKNDTVPSTAETLSTLGKRKREEEKTTKPGKTDENTPTYEPVFKKTTSPKKAQSSETTHDTNKNPNSHTPE